MIVALVDNASFAECRNVGIEAQRQPFRCPCFPTPLAHIEQYVESQNIFIDSSPDLDKGFGSYVIVIYGASCCTIYICRLAITGLDECLGQQSQLSEIDGVGVTIQLRWEMLLFWMTPPRLPYPELVTVYFGIVLGEL